MSFTESVRDFVYSVAATELGLDCSSPRLWAYLEKAAVAETDLDRAQVVHDLSWALTQCDGDRTAKFNAMRDAIKRTLEDAYGPRIWDFAERVNVTLEGLVVPAAKLDLRPVRGEGSPLEFFLRKLCCLPSPTFAAVFAKCWLRRLFVSGLQECQVTCGQRKLVGTVGDCGQCDGGLRKEELERRLEQVRQAATERVRQAGGRASAAAVPENLKNKVAGFLVKSLVCTSCDRTGLDVARISRDLALLVACNAKGIIDPRTGGLDVKRFKQEYGDQYACRNCRGDVVDAAKCRAALETPLPNQPNKTIKDLLQAMDDNGGFLVEAVIELLGEEVLCPACSRWISVPTDARDGWVWPVTNGRTEICAWTTLRLGD